MTSNQISFFGGIVISLALAYVPGLKDWFELRSSTEKRAILAIAMLVVVLAAVALSCYGITAYITCDKPGLLDVVFSFFGAVIANQTAYHFIVRK